MSPVDVTFLCCTCNRASDLAEMIDSVLAQNAPGRSFEILIVNNNSTDATADVAAEYVKRCPVHVRYLFEERQGKSFALNRALNEIRGTWYQIADDDLVFPPDYLAILMQQLDSDPGLTAAGGRVLPLWSVPPPAWLTPDHYAALALTTYGDKTIETGAGVPLCLLGACYRTEHIRAVGVYHTGIAVTGARGGGIEDAELFDRLYSKGMRGRYVPELSVFHKVEPWREEKLYHRRWHFAHGENFARTTAAAIDVGPYGPWRIPRYMYRELGTGALRVLWERIRGHEAAAFAHETRLLFNAGFARERIRVAVQRPGQPSASHI